MSARVPLQRVVLIMLVVCSGATAAGASASDSVVLSSSDPSNDHAPSTQSSDLVQTMEPNASMWIAPVSAFGNLTTVDAIRAHRENGSLTRSETVALNDTLVIRLRGTGLTEALTSSDPEQNATSRLRTLLDEPNTTFRLVQTNPTPERRVKILTPTRGDLRAVVDRGNDSTYVVLDTTTLRGHRDPDDAPDLPARFGERYELRFVLDGEPQFGPYTDDARAESPAITVVEPDASVGGEHTPDGVFVASTADQRIVGWTTLAPGSLVTVRLTGPQFERSKRVRVRDSPTGSRFEARFDTRNLSRGSSVDIEVRAGGRVLRPVSGQVFDGTASVDLPEREELGDGAVRVRSVSTSDGGFVVIQGGGIDGLVLGHSEYLPAGTTSVQVSVRTDDLHRYVPRVRERAVAVVYPDVDGDRTFDSPHGLPYMANGTVVTDVATVSDADSLGRPGQDETERTATTASTTTHRTTEPTPTSASTRSDGQPGFGSLVALAVLLVAGGVRFATAP